MTLTHIYLFTGFFFPRKINTMHQLNINKYQLLSNYTIILQENKLCCATWSNDWLHADLQHLKSQADAAMSTQLSTYLTHVGKSMFLRDLVYRLAVCFYSHRPVVSVSGRLTNQEESCHPQQAGGPHRRVRGGGNTGLLLIARLFFSGKTNQKKSFRCCRN